MNALIVYESMFGNTRKLAEAIADSLQEAGVDTAILHAHKAPSDLSDYRLVVVGAPTHAHSLPRPKSRTEAVEWATDPTKKLTLEPTAETRGVREWLEGVMLVGDPRFAVFSTRADIPRIFSGDACAAIAKGLRRHLADVDARADFLVDLDNHLVAGEEDRAREWAGSLIPVPQPEGGLVMTSQLSADRHTAQLRDTTDPPEFARVSLLVLQALVAITAIAGGAALILGALNAELATVLSPPTAHLEGSPFSSYLVPGLLLAIVVGGTQAGAFLLGVTRSSLGLLGAATAATALLIWVFVQMMFIPFSFLQAIYFAFGIAETCLVLVALGILHVRSTSR